MESTSTYNLVLESKNSTVVAEYKSKVVRSNVYQSEEQLEKSFINQLKDQGYEYIRIKSEADLITNLRARLEELNKIEFTDDEWKRLFTTIIANNNDGIVEKTRRIQIEGRISFRLDNGNTKNITLLEKDHIHENKLQVINQYVDNEGLYKNRYDVTILVNGFPMVHIELKKRGGSIREAFNQINRYQRESFWAQSGLFEYVQIFVISNGTETKYYSNTTRENHIKDQQNKIEQTRTSNSFEFTSYWADATNKIIPDLVDFTATFFAKNTILNILTKYCIFTSEDMLLVMRPYQIVATERIINRIEISNNYKLYGKIEAGGYIWHTTGSGKTLTSFKTAQLATNLEYTDKVLFVVDRKDLDYQTMKEFDRFKKNAANSNTSTAVLKQQLEDSKARIIITTIQKLDKFIKNNPEHEVYKKHVVIIFDECHRSQFGDMHLAITKHFKKYHIFGFTGTPIFAVNASTSGTTIEKRTTEQMFGDRLHTYTIVDAINDQNVLPFRVEYNKTMDKEPDIDDKLVSDIDREKAYNDPKRISLVVTHILDHFNQKTYRNEKTYEFNKVMNITDVIQGGNRNPVEEEKQKLRLNGFNSIFCVSSIAAAKLYYDEFKKQMKENPAKKLIIAAIFSYAANEDPDSTLLDEENSEDTSSLDQSSREFLDRAISDYNKTFKTNYDTSSDKFQNYYKDVSLRMKNKEIDLLIVVNMFLTGFDATTLNTLWVDKNLRDHGLIQAFSRTNRILNSVKRFGNIVCFRNLEKRTDAAIALFGDKDASGIVLLKGYDDYYYGYDDEKGIHRTGYVELIEDLTTKYPLGERIIGEKAQKDFIGLFGAILRMQNLLSSFDAFTPEARILNIGEMQDYTSLYTDLYLEYQEKREKSEKEDINDDIVFEIELLKQVDINIDYILDLVRKYHDSHCEDKEILSTIHRALDSSLELRSKKELIENFINDINDVQDVYLEWHDYVVNEKESELASIIKDENLNDDQTRKFLDNAFEDGTLKTTGTAVDKLLPPMSRFGGEREKKKDRIIRRLLNFFDKYFGIS